MIAHAGPVPVRDPFEVDLERFHGPLDLLLHLIRNQDIDIFDIPIARITEQFLRAVQGVERLELERAGEFLEMAATLVRIKAQMLFPRRGGDDEEADPRAELVRRLLEYEHFREAARLLERAERERARLFRRGFVEVRPVPQPADLPLETTWDEVWEAALRLDERLAAAAAVHTVRGREIRIEDKIAEVMEALRAEKRVEFGRLVAPWGTRIHAVGSLLACLELARRSLVRLRQAAPFASLWIYRPRAGHD
ncbi:MAG TPA: segregation/condensation protein A [Longimicrobiaceae bacterium]|nr:segregation/condensation protein A [Longimicrobiaceae bacterium]